MRDYHRLSSIDNMAQDGLGLVVSQCWDFLSSRQMVVVVCLDIVSFFLLNLNGTVITNQVLQYFLPRSKT